jgi:hypothetical protein
MSGNLTPLRMHDVIFSTSVDEGSSYDLRRACSFFNSFTTLGLFIRTSAFTGLNAFAWWMTLPLLVIAHLARWRRFLDLGPVPLRPLLLGLVRDLGASVAVGDRLLPSRR